MAFRIPTLPASQKKLNTASEQLYSQPVEPQQHLPNDFQEWVLFDPSPPVERTNDTLSARTHTVGRSPTSYYGSLESGIWSDNVDLDIEEQEKEEEEDSNFNFNEDGTNDDDHDDEELDSLDSHLLEFRAEPCTYYPTEPGPSKTVLPTHNGLGSFKLDGLCMSGNDLQEHLYSFERFNPRRVKRRRENLNRDTLEKGAKDLTSETEWLQRIEFWRMEQSRALVDEIQRESRKPSYSTKSERLGSQITRTSRITMTTASMLSTEEELAQENLATLNSTGDETTTMVGKESFINRITRKVIRDLIGIDENILSIIFGESLPHDLGHSCSPAPETHQARSNSYRKYYGHNYTWEYKLLERIARELGFLANRISDHPVRLNNYLLSPRTSFSYAGLPIVPSIIDQDTQALNEDQNNFHATSQTLSPSPSHEKSTSQSHAEFQPTIPNHPKSFHSLAGSTGSGSTNKGETHTRAFSVFRPELTREEWERDLDLKMVFRYIYERVTNKFSSKSLASDHIAHKKCNPTTNTLNNTRNSHPTTRIGRAADLSARAACVRQQHPLISEGLIKRKLGATNRTWQVSVPAGSVSGGGGVGVNLGTGALGIVTGGNCGGGGGGGGGVSFSRRSSNCVALRDREKTACSGSSRHYWDWAESVGSGKATAKSTGAMGSWGEV